MSTLNHVQLALNAQQLLLQHNFVLQVFTSRMQFKLTANSVL